MAKGQTRSSRYTSMVSFVRCTAINKLHRFLIHDMYLLDCVQYNVMASIETECGLCCDQRSRVFQLGLRLTTMTVCVQMASKNPGAPLCQKADQTSQNSGASRNTAAFQLQNRGATQFQFINLLPKDTKRVCCNTIHFELIMEADWVIASTKHGLSDDLDDTLPAKHCPGRINLSHHDRSKCFYRKTRIMSKPWFESKLMAFSFYF